jgi:pimeloyl-ACP methyl ester carboxylesterase
VAAHPRPGRSLRIVAALALAGCAAGPGGRIAAQFPQPPQPRAFDYAIGVHHIHYVEMAGGANARIVFIHGAPGEWTDWAAFLRDPQLRARATLIAPDRPGYGASDPGMTLTDLAAQARLLAPLLHGAPVLLVGHSYGGAVACELAVMQPTRVRGLVLIAPSIDPRLEAPRWYDRWMAGWPWRELLGRQARVANRETLALQPQLASLWSRLRTARFPVTLIQGEDDASVDPRTADDLQAWLPAWRVRVIRVPGADHDLMWRRPRLVIEAMLALLAGSARRAP